MINKILLFGSLFLLGCATTTPPPFIPFKTFYNQPPGSQETWPQPIQLECIDNSNIFVYTNGDWWYSGPRAMDTKGWVPTKGGWYPLPYQVWPDKVYWLTQ